VLGPLVELGWAVRVRLGLTLRTTRVVYRIAPDFARAD
jgi:hypothetical protein